MIPLCSEKPLYFQLMSEQCDPAMLTKILASLLPVNIRLTLSCHAQKKTPCITTSSWYQTNIILSCSEKHTLHHYFQLISDWHYPVMLRKTHLASQLTEALPAVMVPSFLKTVGSLARFSFVAGRGCSSTTKSSGPDPKNTLFSCFSLLLHSVTLTLLFSFSSWGNPVLQTGW